MPDRAVDTIPSKWPPKKPVKADVRAFERLDQDNDEALSPAELLEVTAARDGGFLETNAIIHAWFDLDGNGGIDLAEWQDGRAGNSDLDAPDLTGDAAHELDANGNGKVSRREFWKVVARYVPRKVTRQWYAAQFPGGEVTGSTSWQIDITPPPIVVIGWSSGSVWTVAESWASSDPGSAASWAAMLPREPWAAPAETPVSTADPEHPPRRQEPFVRGQSSRAERYGAVVPVSDP